MRAGAQRVPRPAAAVFPAVEGVAGARRHREGDAAAVVLGEQVGLRIAAVLVEGDVVGVDRPVGVEGDVGRWGIRADLFVREGAVIGEPAVEGVAGARRRWEGDGGAVDGVGVVADRIAAVLFIEDVVLLGRPLRGEGGVAVRDREAARRDQRPAAAIIPAVEGVAGSRRRREGDAAAVGLGEQVGLRIAAGPVFDNLLGAHGPVRVLVDVVLG